jgi:hypothetical protein
MWERLASGIKLEVGLAQIGHAGAVVEREAASLLIEDQLAALGHRIEVDVAFEFASHNLFELR